MKKLRILIISILIILITSICMANSVSQNGESLDLTGKMAQLALQLSVIIVAAWGGGVIFSKWKLPSVLGELISGIIIGPYCLGAISFPGFQNGIFPLTAGVSVSVELYSFATIASIILLFLVGLETDIETFLKYSFAGTCVGISGVLFSFAFGDFVGILFYKHVIYQSIGFMHPAALFMGVISTATSVGISARILSEKQKLDSPEGVTILSAAVIDDIIGIIALAIVVGIAKSGHVSWHEVASVGFKAIFIWLIFTAMGLTFANKISFVLKKLQDTSKISVMAFAFALFIAAIFEKSGLAMIIGAYVMGLSLSKTDISFTIQDHFKTTYNFFVPVFFCVMGMLVNIKEIWSPNILIFGFVYVVFAVLGKLIGCFLPALFLNFNVRGALRIGVGMIPRGEVALIIAGIGLSTGVIPQNVFNISILMTFVTTLITPPILSKMLESKERVLRGKEQEEVSTHKDIVFEMPNQETSEMILNKIIMFLENEGFFVHKMHMAESLYQIRKDGIFITLKYYTDRLEFICLEKDTSFVHTVFYEVLIEFEFVMKNLKMLTNIEAVGKKMFDSKDDRRRSTDVFLNHNLFPLSVSSNLKATNKEEVLAELVSLLVKSGQLQFEKKQLVIQDLLEREKLFSTGMQDSIALPHSKTDHVDKIMIAIGVSKLGIDFDSMDNKLSQIFILTIVPKANPQPYLQFISKISRILSDPKTREEIINAKHDSHLYELMLESEKH